MRVLVTRPEPEAGATADRLRAHGHDPLVAPLMAAEAVTAAMPLPRPDALAVTSGRTASFLGAGLAAALRHLPVFAVGGRTAGILEGAGFADVHAAEGDVAALARLIAASGLPAGSRLLHPGGEERAGDLGALLAATGIAVMPWIVYRMVPASALPAAVGEALAKGQIQAVLHYSPRSAAIFATLALAAGLGAAAARPLHACLSTAVAAALAPLRPDTVRVAASPDEKSLIRLLDAGSGCG